MDINRNYLYLMRVSNPFFSIAREIHRKLFNKYYRRTFPKIVKESEWYSKEQLENIQLKKLKIIVKHSYDTIPFYKRLLGRNNISPNDIKRLGDMKKLPVIKKSDIIKHDLKRELLSRKINLKDTIMVRSSGSTGSPLTSLHSKDSILKHFSYIIQRRLKWAGLSVFDREMVMGRRETQYTFSDFKIRPDMISLRPFVFDRKKCSDFMKIFDVFKPDYIRCYPQNLAQISRFVIENDIDVHIKAAIVGGNMLLDNDKSVIERAFSTKTFQGYMCSKVGLVANECENHRMHLAMERVIVETVDGDGDDSGNRPGRVLLTGLDNRAMPFIRYEVGDIAKLRKNGCGCKREHIVLDGLRGRSNDVIITPSGNSVHMSFFIGLFSRYQKIINFRVVQEDANNISVYIHIKNGFSKRAEKSLLKHLEENLEGMSIKIESRKNEFDLHNYNKFRHIENRFLKRTAP